MAKKAENSEVQHPRLHEMLHLRKTPRCFEKVRYLPYMFQKLGLQGRNPRRKEVELVIGG